MSASSTTTTTTPSPPTTTTTTTTEGLAESSPVLIAFDGKTCTVTGGPLEAGLADISMLNTSPASADALLLLLTESLTLDDVADDVAAGLYDDFNPPPLAFRRQRSQREPYAPGASLDDGPASEAGGVVFSIMPEGMSEALTKTINAKSGTWAVVCLQMTTSMAYMGTDVIEVP